jgi:hypothetical protein
LKFDIIDTGCGVKKEYIDIITREHTSISFVIIRNIIQLMNGVLWLDWTEENKGSKFSFIIQVSQFKIDNHLYTKLPNLRAMVITENKDMKLDLSNILLTNAIDPTITNSIQESYFFFSRVKIDFIICDLDTIEHDNLMSFLQEKSNLLIIGIGDNIDMYSKITTAEYKNKHVFGNKLMNIIYTHFCSPL